MAKKNQRRPSRHGRLKTGCISGLISFFDFRQGQIDRRRLLSDGRLSFKHSADGGNSRDRGADEASKITEDPEDEIPLTDMARTSVKELIEEELINEETFLNLCNDSEIKSSDVENDAAGCLLEEIGIISDSKTPDKLDPDSRMDHCEAHGEEFIDSVKIMTSNDGLFLELLKESDPVLLKGIPNSMDSDGFRSRKPKNFFRRRSKTLESFPEDYSDKTPALNGGKSSVTDVIDVISSPSWYGLNKLQNERSTSSRFSFTEIKRRLWHAMGKEKVMASDKMASPDHHQMRRRNSGWSSPNRSHFYTERFMPSPSPARKGMNQKQILDVEFDIYAEARKHLSEMLKNSSEGSSDSVAGKLPKTLGGILSLPKKCDEDARNVLQESCDRSKLEIPEEVADIEELSESSLKEGESSCESCNGSTDETTSCLKPEFTGEEDHSFSSPTAVVGPEDFDRAVDDKAERPSPVSVLELVFVDDVCSPARSSASETVRDIQPQYMSFDDQHQRSSPSAKDRDPLLLCTRISMESEETPFEYVEAVLLGSGLDWNAFFARWLSSQPILDSTLFDEVEIFSSQPRRDQRLLFDSANEALRDVTDVCFGYSSTTTAVPWALPPRSADLIEAIWSHVRWHLSQKTPHSLDQLVRMDLAGTDAWAKLDPVVEIVVFEVGEIVFGEMLDDDLNEFLGGLSEI